MKKRLELLIIITEQMNYKLFFLKIAAIFFLCSCDRTVSLNQNNFAFKRYKPGSIIVFKVNQLTDTFSVIEEELRLQQVAKNSDRLFECRYIKLKKKNIGGGNCLIIQYNSLENEPIIEILLSLENCEAKFGNAFKIENIGNEKIILNGKIVQVKKLNNYKPVGKNQIRFLYWNNDYGILSGELENGQKLEIFQLN